MKKTICIAAAIIAIISLSACGSQDTTGYVSSNADSLSVDSSENEIKESSTESEEDSTELPDGVIKYKKGMFKFASKDGKTYASFPSDFCKTNEDYLPTDGICLCTSDGRETLQLESIKCKGIEKEDLVTYLETTYPDAQVEISDSRLVICKMTTKDKSGNEVCALMKARVNDDGYNTAVLYFHKEDTKQSENLFNKITLL